MDLGLRGKRAVVTGASRGIGQGVAAALAREGADVVMAARGAEGLAAAAEEIAAQHGVRTHPVPCDLGTAAGCARLAETVAELGGADILINNAGTGSNETIREAPDDKWQAYWDLHVMAAVRLSRALAPGMQARGGGAILHVASVCATQPLWYEPIYNVTKAALVMLSKCMAAEFIPLGIRVNAVSPGLILTPDWIRTARDLAPDGDWQGYLRRVAEEHATIRRFGTVEELADFMVFLVSPRCAYASGSNFAYDGGMLRTI
ncbi:Short-chain dehydrogenase [Rubellimicrobium thermophilum DSM 16684]|uniref:Short-chain dehydrogenase n=1 Tax=Rubellimicrobium thermophilum DSM 16684 TaxID=1123069 RepID=S9QXL2_9RHOB|nr:SDR family oxidoreductase [Rubellimicrobium thermophilum]EPX84347.1 Short-chain dehydrogenase [Rubellimicrobium thermophilum DSM 16684]